MRHNSCKRIRRRRRGNDVYRTRNIIIIIVVLCLYNMLVHTERLNYKYNNIVPMRI